MQTHVIRRQIAQAIAHESFSGSAAQTLRQARSQHGARPKESDIEQTISFIRDYIEQVPDLLDACAAASQQVGISNYAIPILEAAQQYFVSPLDVIFDHFGLIGLMDDAYFAQRLLQSISDSYRLWTGRPLLPFDLGPINAAIRQLIGEPQASQLDTAVEATLRQASVKRAFHGLTSYADTLPLTGPAQAASRFGGMMEGARTADAALEPAEREQVSKALRPESLKLEDSAAEDEGELTAGYQVLLELFREKVRAGEFSPERQEALAPIVEELGAVIRERPEDVAGMMGREARVRDLMGRMTTAMAEPTHEEGAKLPPGSRAERVNRHLQAVKRFLFIEAGRAHKAEGENEAIEKLYLRSARAGTSLHQLAGEDDAAAVALERETLRRLALDTRHYAMRHYLTLAEPIWSSPPVAQDVNAIFFSGGAEVSDWVAQGCASRRLELLLGSAGRDYAQARWDSLRSSNVAVFDLTTTATVELAAVCYELGIALALGRSIVIIARHDADLPFDVDLVPVLLQDDGEDAERVGVAIDDALYGQQRGGGDSSIEETLAYARRRTDRDDASWEIKHTLASLDEASHDPIKVGSLIDGLLGLVGAGAPIALQPAWPGSYPEPGARRCFHVMPFDAGGSGEVMGAVREACETAGYEYVGADAVGDRGIIRSIWNEICRASHIVVDLTGFDPNVALELGIAHTLGRATLIVGEGDTVERLFASLVEVRVLEYGWNGEGPQLRELTERFLS